MRYLRALVLLLALLATACGGGDDADTTSGANDNSGDPNELTTNFNLDDLPDDFDASLVPPSWTAGQATDLLGPFIVNFETDMAFTDVVAYYEGVLGPKTLMVGDPGEQLAQWTDDPDWVTSVFDGDPVLVGFASLEE